MNKSKLEKALEVAATVHLLQKRKKTEIPYIVHPFSVMLNAARVTQNEDTLCACLLHDVLEDGELDKYGEQDMLNEFGPKVTETVKAVTKDESIKGWRAGNEDYLARLDSSHNQSALIVCAADKIHNLKSILADYEQIGDDLWNRFNAGKEQQKWWYRAVLSLLESKLPDNILVTELAQLVSKLEAL